jgi:type 1 glutamine amidotransferase
VKNQLRFAVQVALVAAYFSSVGPVVAEVPEDVVSRIRESLPDSAPVEPIQPRKVLIFTKTNGFRHDSIPVAVQALTMLGDKTGAYSSIHTEDDSYFEPEKLQGFDAVFMVNTTGDVFRPRRLPEGEAERDEMRKREQRLKDSLVTFVQGGKGLCGIHSATDTYHDWKEYNDMMGGAFAGHPWHESVPVRLLDPAHPLNRVFGGEGFMITDEIYQFRNDTAQRTDRRMLLSLAPDWSELSRGNRDDDFYPISWIDRYGDGRIFYCSLGHRDEIYWNPVILEHYLAGFQFALGDLEAEAEPLSGDAE